jgi:Uncharacterised protein family (UPF0236)
MQRYPELPQAESLSAMESAVREMMSQLGQVVLGEWLTKQDPKYPAEGVACRCGKVAHYERRREAITLTLQGRVSYRRAYYGCECGQGCCPLDDALGIQPGQMSEQLRKVAARFGISEAYARSAEALAAVTGVSLSANSVRQACLALGQQVVEQEQTLLARSQDLTEQLRQRREGPHPKQLYASLDGFYAPFEDGYHEVKMGAFWEVNAAQHAQNIQYYLETEGLERFSDLVWARAFARGAPQADQLIFIADGAVWIWRIVAKFFPQAIQIVDWYHAVSYLVKVAHAAFGDGTESAKRWLDLWRPALYEGRLASVVGACRAVKSLAPKAVAEARHYFATNRTRLRYGKFQAMGLQIGSGSMESGCKQLGLARLTIAGACWSHPGARLLGKTRAAFLSRELTLPSLGSLQVA